MGALEMIIGIIVILVSLAIIIGVIFQQSHRRGVNGVISGAADSFFSKNKAKTAEAKIAKLTKVLAIVFFVLVILANIIAIASK